MSGETDAKRAPRVVIAVGNALRGDDAAGLEVARRIEGRLPAGVELVCTRGDATALLELWRNRRLAVVIDAVHGGDTSGEVLEIDVLGEGLPAAVTSASTHDFGLPQALDLGTVLEELPDRLHLIGIVGTRYGIGDALSAAVGDALDAAADKVLAVLEATGD